ncbi:MAG: DciA family protein [Actinobacteria bacterium]|nr:DciA family protein [Actinomycetota bacterium]
MSDEEPGELKGPDLARAALAQARAAARAKGLKPGQTGRPRRLKAVPERSGSGPDARDPVLFGAAVRRLVAERGWEDTTTAAGVLANWDRLVGPEIADHCQPTALVDGELTLVAESSAWATQLRLLTRTMTAKIREQVGADVVTSIVVRGPAQPDWRKGPRRVQGPGARGPRDTYG